MAAGGGRQGSADHVVFTAVSHMTIHAKDEVTTVFDRLADGVCAG